MVSDAMVTGRTRALAMKLGVIDLGDAHANFAKQLGVEVEMLSDTGKAEAARVQVMKMLSAAVADAGEQQKDFGEKIDTAMTALANWGDRLAVAVTQSPVLTAMVDKLGEAFSNAFGSRQTGLIDGIVNAIEKMLIFTTNLGIATVEATRVIYTAWKVVETVALATGTAVMGVATAVAATGAGMTGLAASLPGATQGMKEMARVAAEHATVMKAMTGDMAKQTLESGKAVLQQGEFHETLDRVSGAIMNVKDAMVTAASQTRVTTKETEGLTVATNAVSQATQRANQSFIDQAKAQKQQEEGLKAAQGLWREYHSIIASQSGTTTDKQIADVAKWKADLTTKMKEAHTDTKEFYEALEAVSHAKTRSVMIDWDLIRDKSVESLREQHERAKATYAEMQSRASELTRGALQEQLNKVRETAFALSAMGQEATRTASTTEQAAETAAAAYTKWLNAIRRTAEESRRLRESESYSFDVTPGNIDDVAKGFNVSSQSLQQYLRQGYSVAQALNAIRNPFAPPPSSLGPRVPGFREGVKDFSGGMAWVGEAGAELVNLPAGSDVIPRNKVGGTTIHQTNHLYITAPTNEMARTVIRKIDEQMKSGRKWPAV
jgi:hypothetical protein